MKKSLTALAIIALATAAGNNVGQANSIQTAPPTEILLVLADEKTPPTRG